MHRQTEEQGHGPAGPVASGLRDGNPSVFQVNTKQGLHISDPQCMIHSDYVTGLHSQQQKEE